MDINGISTTDRATIMGQLGDARKVPTTSGPWDVRAEWVAGFTSFASTRGHEIRFDRVSEVGACSGHPAPHEYLLAAIAGCLISGVVRHATVQGVQLRVLSVSVSGTFEHALRWASPGSETAPGYAGIDLHARISGDAEDDVLREIWERAIAGSPVAQTVSRPTPLIAVLDVE